MSGPPIEVEAIGGLLGFGYYSGQKDDMKTAAPVETRWTIPLYCYLDVLIYLVNDVGVTKQTYEVFFTKC